LPGVNRTLVIVKPDAVERGLIGEVIARLERKQLRVVAAELRLIDVDTARRHYTEHEGKPFLDRVIAGLTRSAALVLIVEGPGETWQVVRAMIGATDPAKAAPGTIRGDLAIDMSENVIHASDSVESALREIAIFFPDLA